MPRSNQQFGELLALPCCSHAAYSAQPISALAAVLLPRHLRDQHATPSALTNTELCCSLHALQRLCKRWRQGSGAARSTMTHQARSSPW